MVFEVDNKFFEVNTLVDSTLHARVAKDTSELMQKAWEAHGTKAISAIQSS